MKVVFCRGPATERGHGLWACFGAGEGGFGALGCSPVPGKVVGTGSEGTWLTGDTADEGGMADGAALLMEDHCWHGGTQLMMGGHGLAGGYG